MEHQEWQTQAGHQQADQCGPAGRKRGVMVADMLSLLCSEPGHTGPVTFAVFRT